MHTYARLGLTAFIQSMTMTCMVLFSACTSTGLSVPNPAGPIANSGGTVETGGAIVIGGNLAIGGQMVIGGQIVTGGEIVTGGNPSVGGYRNTGGIVPTGGAPSPEEGTSCPGPLATAVPCGGDVTGTWTVNSSCIDVSGRYDLSNLGIGCSFATVTGGRLDVTGAWSATADGKFTDNTTTKGSVRFTLDSRCLEVSGTTTNCPSIANVLSTLGFETVRCGDISDRGCACSGSVNQKGGAGLPSPDPLVSGKFTTAGNVLTYPDNVNYAYCANGNLMTWTPKITYPTLTGPVTFQKVGGPATGGAIRTGGNPGSGGSGGIVITGGSPTTGGILVTGGTPASSGGTMACPSATGTLVPCGGDVTGTWTVTPSCLNVSGSLDLMDFGLGCRFATVTGGSLEVKGTWTAAADGKFTDNTTTKGSVRFSLESRCLEVSGTITNCPSIASALPELGFESASCDTTADRGCACLGIVNQKGGVGSPSRDPLISGKSTRSGNQLNYPDDSAYLYCTAGNRMTWTPKSASPTVTGTVVFQKGGTVGTGGL